MLTVNEIDKSVIISDSLGDIVIVDGQRFELIDGAIEIYNLPSVFDVEVFKLEESNYIPRPIPEPIPEELIPEEPTPDEIPL